MLQNAIVLLLRFTPSTSLFSYWANTNSIHLSSTSIETQTSDISQSILLSLRFVSLTSLSYRTSQQQIATTVQSPWQSRKSPSKPIFKLTLKSKANKQTMPQAKEKIQRLKAVSPYLQSPEIRSSSNSSCVDTSKQQQQPATKLCQSTKCKTEKYSTPSTIFSFENYKKLRSRASACNWRKNPTYKIHTKLSRNPTRAQRFLELHENRRCASRDWQHEREAVLWKQRGWNLGWNPGWNSGSNGTE